MKFMAAGIGLFMVFLALASFANGEIGGGVLFGLLAWAVLALGSGGDGPPKYDYKGSVHIFRRAG